MEPFRERISASGFTRIAGIVVLLELLLTSTEALAGVTFRDINPNSTPFAGGRVNKLANTGRTTPIPIFYAATEGGGLYKTITIGLTWDRLDRHLPVRVNDVKVDPVNGQVVYATSLYDSRVHSSAGINVSYDGGLTWTHPATSTPPPGFVCGDAWRRAEPSAFGIGIRPDAPQNVFIGTDCGVAISTDAGVTWTFVDPTPATPPHDIRGVVVQAGGPTNQGIVDVCGTDGHFRSTDGGATWTGGVEKILHTDSSQLSDEAVTGCSSIAVSPDEPYVLFMAGRQGTALNDRFLESDDGGRTWTEFSVPTLSNRDAFIATNKRSLGYFDLWWGGIGLFRTTCHTPNPPAIGGSSRCSPSPLTWVDVSPPHGDSNDIIFDPTATNDACPLLVANDAGPYLNVDPVSHCLNPQWVQPVVSPHALELWGMAGVDQPGVEAEDLYFGTNDNDHWGTRNAGAAVPVWTKGGPGADDSSVFADESHVFWSENGGEFFMAGPGFADPREIPLPGVDPNTPNPLAILGSYIARTGGFPEQYVVVTRGGAFFTGDITADPVSWTQLAADSTPPGGFMSIQMSLSGGFPVGGGIIFRHPTFYAQTYDNQLWKLPGILPTDAWQRVDNKSDLTAGGIHIFAVDPNSPNRLYAATKQHMVFSTDGGDTWNIEPKLDNLMIGGGAFQYDSVHFMLRGSGLQPTLLAFDREDPNIRVAGGAESGVFLSTNGGQDWRLLTDPYDSGNSGIPHLPRPIAAYFDHEPAGTINLYIGTHGRGVWRISIRPPVASFSSGISVTTIAGEHILLDASASRDPDGQPLTFEWDLDNDGNFNDAAGPTAVFDRVGLHGVFTVRVKVSAGGAFSIAETTVTVRNVPPSVSLNSNAPKDENSAVTVSGLVSDPGWLDPLTATIDWGDGTAIKAIAGTLENIRPDATLSFSLPHTYGDVGTFTARVCGSDDLTSTCQTIGLQINNVNPTAELSTTGATSINGVSTFLAHAGQLLTFGGRSRDPGSDDLFLTWTWGDGTMTGPTSYLVNPPNPDPVLSPSIQPRDVTDTKSHTFAKACFYTITFASRDDDGGTGQVTGTVVIVGNAGKVRGAGYWQSNYEGRGTRDFDQATLTCYLSIAGYMSRVFNEARDASTILRAIDVLSVNQSNGDMQQIFDRQLLAVWVNFANGSIGYNQLVDTNGDRIPDTTFSTAVSTAEAVRLNPNATSAQLEAQKNILESINLMNQ